MEILSNEQKLTIYYKLYVEEIAKLIKSFNGLDMYQQVLLYNNLLHYGLLSAEEGFKYHKYPIDFNKQYVLGARIASGTGVCRHMTENQRDVFSELGYETLKVICLTSYGKLAKKFPHLTTFMRTYSPINKKNSTHCMAGIYTESEHLISCPTGCLAGIVGKEKIITMKNTRYPYKQPREFIESQLFPNTIYQDEYIKYLKMLELPNILENRSDYELQETYLAMECLFLENYGDFKNWKKEHLDLMNEVKMLDYELSKYSDNNSRARVK